MDLKAWRKANALSQAQLAALLSVHLNTVANWEKSGKPLPSDWEAKLAGVGKAAADTIVCYATHPQLYNVIRMGRSNWWFKKLAHPHWWDFAVKPTKSCYPKDLIDYAPPTPESAIRIMIEHLKMSEGAAYSRLLTEMGESLTAQLDPEAEAALKAFMNGLPQKKKDEN